MLTVFLSIMLRGEMFSILRMHDLTTIGGRLRAAREEAGLNQSELARAVGVTRGAVSQWESGTVDNLRNQHLFAVCEAVGVNPKWLALGAGDRHTRTVKKDELTDRWLAMLHGLPEEQARLILAMYEAKESSPSPTKEINGDA